MIEHTIRVFTFLLTSTISLAYGESFENNNITTYFESIGCCLDFDGLGNGYGNNGYSNGQGNGYGNNEDGNGNSKIYRSDKFWDSFQEIPINSELSKHTTLFTNNCDSGSVLLFASRRSGMPKSTSFSNLYDEISSICTTSSRIKSTTSGSSGNYVSLKLIFILILFL